MSGSLEKGEAPAPLLSIVVPTLDRRHLLENTLTALLREISGLQDLVELVVVNNASEDDTAAFLAAWSARTGIRSESYSQRVEADVSFQRCVDIARGRYINIFGDDDLPIPGFVRRSVDFLQTYEPGGFLYFNRLIGDEQLNDIAELAHPYRNTEFEILDVSDVLTRYTHAVGFITALVFSRDCWNRGGYFEQDKFRGYKFLARICAGAHNQRCVYVGMPALIQRRGRQSWKAHWPRYWLVSMPQLLKAFDAAGIANGAFDAWLKHDTSLKRVIVDCLVAKAYGYDRNDSFWLSAASSQPFSRALAIHMIRHFVPQALAKFIYFGLSKYRRGASK